MHIRAFDCIQRFCICATLAIDRYEDLPNASICYRTEHFPFVRFRVEHFKNQSKIIRLMIDYMRCVQWGLFSINTMNSPRNYITIHRTVFVCTCAYSLNSEIDFYLCAL